MLPGKLDKTDMKRMLMRCGGREPRSLILPLPTRGACVTPINKHLEPNSKLSDDMGLVVCVEKHYVRCSALLFFHSGLRVLCLC